MHYTTAAVPVPVDLLGIEPGKAGLWTRALTTRPTCHETVFAVFLPYLLPYCIYNALP